jgi:hypothetical protein
VKHKAVLEKIRVDAHSKNEASVIAKKISELLHTHFGVHWKNSTELLLATGNVLAGNNLCNADVVISGADDEDLIHQIGMATTQACCIVGNIRIRLFIRRDHSRRGDYPLVIDCHDDSA